MPLAMAHVQSCRKRDQNDGTSLDLWTLPPEQCIARLLRAETRAKEEGVTSEASQKRDNPRWPGPLFPTMEPATRTYVGKPGRQRKPAPSYDNTRGDATTTNTPTSSNQEQQQQQEQKLRRQALRQWATAHSVDIEFIRDNPEIFGSSSRDLFENNEG